MKYVNLMRDLVDGGGSVRGTHHSMDTDARLSRGIPSKRSREVQLVLYTTKTEQSTPNYYLFI